MLLAELEGRANRPGEPRLTEDERAIVRQARRDYDRATRLPAEFVRAKAEQGSRGYHAWARARAADDFAGYAPVLEKNLEFAHREAAYLGCGSAPYDYLLDKHDPGLTAAVVERLFDELKRELVPLGREILASPIADGQSPSGLSAWPNVDAPIAIIWLSAIGPSAVLSSAGICETVGN